MEPSPLPKGGLTQAEIGGRVGWSRKQVSDYAALIDKIAPQVLGLAKKHQGGRGAANAPSGANFTEGWFRSSGLYDINEEHQLALQVKRARQTAKRKPKSISREITRE